ncbi:hypothetical protein OAH18_01315 [bacterium]|nr:hypothetical protein [bacterium]
MYDWLLNMLAENVFSTLFTVFATFVASAISLRSLRRNTATEQMSQNKNWPSEFYRNQESFLKYWTEILCGIVAAASCYAVCVATYWSLGCPKLIHRPVLVFEYEVSRPLLLNIGVLVFSIACGRLLSNSLARLGAFRSLVSGNEKAVEQLNVATFGLTAGLLPAIAGTIGYVVENGEIAFGCVWLLLFGLIVGCLLATRRVIRCRSKQSAQMMAHI